MISVSTQLRVKELLREKGWTTKILAEKTGMSESYLTHIKNGTRRWNEDSLRKLSQAFEISPIDLFAEHRQRTDDIDKNVSMPEQSDLELQVKVVPVVGSKRPRTTSETSTSKKAPVTTKQAKKSD